MNDALKKRIEFLREKLTLEPLGPTFGDIPAGNPKAKSGNDALDAFLAVADGGMFGRVDFFPNAALPGNQFRLASINDTPANWIYIAQLLYEPILIARGGDKLALVDDKENLGDFGVLDVLLSACFNAQSYAQLAPELQPDDWQRFLEKYPSS